MDNTHYYDGKLDFSMLHFPAIDIQSLIDKFVTDIKPENLENYDSISQQLNNVSVEEVFKIVKRAIVFNLVYILKDKITSNAFAHLDVMIKDYGTDKNYDKTNNICGVDLLYLISYHLDNKDFIILLNEQLENMSSGFCQQGRTHRLFQLVLTFQ